MVARRHTRLRLQEAVVREVQADRTEGERDEHAFLLDGMRQSSKSVVTRH